jgi:hypothetical protein
MALSRLRHPVREISRAPSLLLRARLVSSSSSRSLSRYFFLSFSHNSNVIHIIFFFRFFCCCCCCCCLDWWNIVDDFAFDRICCGVVGIVRVGMLEVGGYVSEFVLGGSFWLIIWDVWCNFYKRIMGFVDFTVLVLKIDLIDLNLKRESIGRKDSPRGTKWCSTDIWYFVDILCSLVTWIVLFQFQLCSNELDEGHEKTQLIHIWLSKCLVK